MEPTFFAHSTADVSPRAAIGAGTRIWQHCQVREDVVIGQNCILSKGVYVDAGVRIGSNVKIQNGISVYHGVTLEDGVFCGPHCVFTNDKQPRAINPDGSLKSMSDWQVSETLVKTGGVARRACHRGVRSNGRALGDDRRGCRGHARCARLRFGVRQPGAAARFCLPLRREAAARRNGCRRSVAAVSALPDARGHSGRHLCPG